MTRPLYTTNSHRQTCIQQAKANSEWFGVPYMVFADTSGNWRTERLNPNALHPYEAFQPSEKAKQAAERRDRDAQALAERNADSAAGDVWGSD